MDTAKVQAAILRGAQGRAPQDDGGSCRDGSMPAIYCQRRASSFNRNTIGERGSAKGAIAVMWLASGTTPKRVGRPAAPQTSTIWRLWRKYSALSVLPT